MAQRDVKRTAVEARPDDAWDDPWLDPTLEQAGKVARYAGKRVFALSSRLARWGGFAGILGGILWGAIFLLLQLEAFSVEHNWYIVAHRVSSKLLVVPLLLFLLCLIALLIQQEVQALRSAGLRRAGFIAASFGLIATMLSTLDEYWLSRLVGQPSNGIIDYVYAGSLFDWGRVTFPQLMLMGVGLALFGSAIIRAGALPNWVAIWFATTSLGIFTVPIGISFFITGYEMFHLLYGSGVFVAVMLLFGASWAALGYALLRGDHRGKKNRVVE